MAIAGAAIMIMLALVGVICPMTFDGQLVQNRIDTVFIAIVLCPLLIIALGTFFGFLRNALLAFFSETFGLLFQRSGR